MRPKQARSANMWSFKYPILEMVHIASLLLLIANCMTIVSDSSQAEEEFSKAQEVFEEINKELREELPVLYQRLVQLY